MKNHLFRKGDVTHRFRCETKEGALRCLKRCLPKTWDQWTYAGTDDKSTSFNFRNKPNYTKRNIQLPCFRVGKFTKHGSF